MVWPAQAKNSSYEVHAACCGMCARVVTRTGLYMYMMQRMECYKTGEHVCEHDCFQNWLHVVARAQWEVHVTCCDP